MKNKLGIKSRIFISLLSLPIILVNIFIFVLYIIINVAFTYNTTRDLETKYTSITILIDKNKEKSFSLPEKEQEVLNSLGLFYIIGNNDKTLQKDYKLGADYYNNKSIIAYRGDYNGYNIIIGKNITELNDLKNNYLNFVIIVNIILIFIVTIISFFLSKSILKPLFEISNFIQNYDFNKTQGLIENKYGNSEIGKYINSTNKFIEKINNIFLSQKDFIQDVSHELKTPLMQIQSTIELMEERITDEKTLTKIENIKSSSQNINNIVSKLSFLLRDIEFLSKQEINLEDYFKGKIQNFSELANTKNINFELIVNYNLTIENNLYYIDRLFDNLITNSILYNNGNNTIKIIIGEKFVEIYDNGIGIAEDKINKIFNRFYRDENSKIYYENGSGLGLSIVEKICKMFGWEIEINSILGEYTSIKIVF